MQALFKESKQTQNASLVTSSEQVLQHSEIDMAISLSLSIYIY